MKKFTFNFPPAAYNCDKYHLYGIRYSKRKILPIKSVYRRHYFNIKCTNYVNFQITVDVSPPLPGHVLDAEPGNKDIDYQSSLLVHASWNGFFDRESGIKYYKYAIHTSCLDDTDFEVGASPQAEV